jgi:predicted pyridoxine 5'-phosphate oxidase superfamily flavin-nucleotide-binding protein
MRALQDRFDGRRVADRLSERRRHYDFWPQDRDLIETAPFFFIATAYGPHVDCSMRAGVPGFVRIVGPGMLEWPEYDGNSMYRTLGNITRNPHVGLLFVKFDGVSSRTRINGEAVIVDDAAAVAAHNGAKVVVRVACELYTNCPRAVHDLPGGRLPDYVPRPAHTPPPPAWKSRDYIRDVLPADDPHAAEVQAMPVLRE